MPPTTKKPTATDPEPPYPKPGLVGPADTDNPDVRVSSAPPTPTGRDLHTGTTITAVALPDRPAPPGPLQLASEPRTESYELVAPGGTVVEVTHNIDIGQRSYHWTDRTTLARRQVPDPGDGAA